VLEKPFLFMAARSPLEGRNGFFVLCARGTNALSVFDSSIPRVGSAAAASSITLTVAAHRPLHGVSARTRDE